MADAATTTMARLRWKAAGGPATCRGREATRLAIEARAALDRGDDATAEVEVLWEAVRGIAITHGGKVCARERTSLDDGLQECYLILLLCLPRYDPEMAEFNTYYIRSIYCRLSRRMRDARNVVRVPHGLGFREQWAGAGRSLGAAQVGGGLLVAPEADDPGEALDRADRLGQVRLAMATLDPREREVVARRYAERPATLAEMGAILGVTRERVRQIQERAMRKLRRALRAEAIPAPKPTPATPPAPTTEAPASPLGDGDAAAIRRALAAGEGRHALAARYGVDARAVALIGQKKAWRHVAVAV